MQLPRSGALRAKEAFNIALIMRRDSAYSGFVGAAFSREQNTAHNCNVMLNADAVVKP
jgi:hypothetical protein